MWMRIELTFLGSLTSLTLDQQTVNKVTKGTDYYLGNYTTNSYLYLGGMPPWYTTKLASLALPSVVFEPRFEGEVRNLVYSNTEGGRPKHQDMMAYKDVRLTTLDHCSKMNPCKNSGVCLSSDRGAECECRNIRFKGQFCEIGLPDDELSVWGSGYLAMNLARAGPLSAPLLAHQDNITLHFKTETKDGILFFSAYSGDYMSLYMKDGEIKLDLRIGTGRLKTGVSKQRFDDNEWHTVIIHRKANKLSNTVYSCKVTLEVDKTHKERWTSPGIYNLLASSHVYLGGVPEKFGRSHHHKTLSLPDIATTANYIGCLKNVEFIADSIRLELIQLGQSGNQIVTAHGNLEYKCTSVHSYSVQQDVRLTNFYEDSSSGAITFTRPNAFLTVPGFTDERRSQISLRIRTLEHSGTLLYCPGQSGHFFGVELFTSHLYLHYNLGTGHVKIRISGNRLDDGKWHHLEIERRGGEGTILLDGEQHQFNIPGQPPPLQFLGMMYLGGVPPFQIPHPPQVWSATLSQGYVGCVRDLVVQGFPIQLSELAEKQDTGSILLTCSTPKRTCTDQLCQHGGLCVEGWNRFSCDCSRTGYTGPTCTRDTPTLHLTGHEDMKVLASAQSDIEADDISIRFKTIEPSGVIFSTSDDWSTDRLEISLSRGGLVLTIRMDGHESVMLSGFGLDNGEWHTIHVVRHGRHVLLEVDGVNQRTETLMSATAVLKRGRYTVGAGVTMPLNYPNFSGDIQQVIVNGKHLLDLEREHLLTNSERSAEFKEIREDPYQPITFTSRNTFLGLPQMKTYFDLEIRLMFRTKEKYGLLLYNGGKATDFLAVELMDGHIHLLISLDKKTIQLKDNHPNLVSDNDWHTLVISRVDLETVVIGLDDTTSRLQTTSSSNSSLNLDGILFLGGARPGMFSDLPPGIQSKYGFKGCIGSLELSGEYIDPIKSAVLPSTHVKEGCEEHRIECGKSTCGNQGVCRVRPTPTAICDCELTSFTGPTCMDESSSFEWKSKTGLITYQYPAAERLEGQILAFGLITPNSNSVILRNPFTDGKVLVSFYTENREILVRENSLKINDGKYHVIRFSRTGSQALLHIDDYQFQIERPFQGVISGLVYNTIRPLDLAKERKDGASIMGDIKYLHQIPFNYRDYNLDEFERMQQTDSSDTPGVQDDIIIAKCISKRKNLSSKCYQYAGSGDELITPVYISPPDPPALEDSTPWVHPCLDDEDCWIQEGSADKDPETTTSNPWRYTTYPYYPDTTTQEPLDQIYQPEYPIYPGEPPTYPPTQYHPTNGRSYENYDQKYNIYENPEEQEPGDNPREKIHHNKAGINIPGTLLIIGIVFVILIAIILIIVIVFKMRTHSEASVKVVESKSYSVDPSTPPVLSSTQVKPVKTNNNKPVKEWYV
ncbi:neurexin-1 [Eurytemora carolleeae]|uniref:neurexin-1 n=1 Tax=Eurytemora carolleeae TaxID=1294199 RepID=UPI000C76309B|nr:neurexin-1 [Eurytemora carolleeae]|eukprot:XP_023324977.1 neurexin-1-like [Eurytemora affinis]